jgi:hypothetical protein
MKVGIFFKIENQFLTDAVPIADGEPYGEAVQYGGHYDFHELLIPATPFERRFKARDYDFYPRGRVVFFPATNLFRLYIDPCLAQDDIKRLTELFELTAAQIEIATDEHYRCARCNKNYVA